MFQKSQLETFKLHAVLVSYGFPQVSWGSINLEKPLFLICAQSFWLKHKKIICVFPLLCVNFAVAIFLFQLLQRGLVLIVHVLLQQFLLTPFLDQTRVMDLYFKFTEG